jgi:hypothetical protein
VATAAGTGQDQISDSQYTDVGDGLTSADSAVRISQYNVRDGLAVSGKVGSCHN